MKFEPIIGLEIHAQLKTKTKMFCGCSAEIWKAEPNTHVCPVCLGLPGALPVINKTALEQALKVSLVLTCKINENTFFERKNYFYPDLPKGYQISQYRAPLGVDGKLGDVKLKRVHVEEDTAKSIHQKDSTLIDFNKSGIPLLEIVSEPVIHSARAAVDFGKAIQKLLRRIGASDADMEKGHLRLEANVSLREVKAQNSNVKTSLPQYRVELKNINSFRFLRKALEYEINRQSEALQRGEQLRRETRGYDENTGKTFVQRVKEKAEDYRYFPEPDLPPLKISEQHIKRVKESLPQSQKESVKELVEAYKISPENAEILCSDGKKAAYFKKLVDFALDPREAANLVINRPTVMDEEPEAVVNRLKKEKTERITDEHELRAVVGAVVEESDEVVEDYRSGKEAALQYLIGQVMQKTQGKADPQAVKDILKSELR